jgi:DNA-binding NarL/FixJ family response regulator
MMEIMNQRNVRKQRVNARMIHVIVLEPLPLQFEPGLTQLLEGLADITLTRRRASALVRNPRSGDQPCVALLGLYRGSTKAQPTIEALWENWGVPTLVVSLNPSLHQLQEVLVSGFRGYLSWPADGADLYGALQLAARGHMVYGPEVLPILPALLEPRNPVIPAPIDLSSKEQAILDHITAGRQNQEIADRLGITLKSVEAYITRLLKKLTMRSRVDLATWWLQQQQAAEGLARRA